MENKLRCEIVQDLLPSYIDGLTSDVTNEAVQEHMTACVECKNMLERMQEPEAVSPDITREKEIDFLKKTRAKTRYTIGAGVLLTIITAVMILFVRFYCIGSSLYAEAVVCKATVMGQTLMLKGTVLDSDLGVSRITCEENDGIVTVSFQATLASPFNKNVIDYDYRAKEPITQVRLGDRIIWDHGVGITANVSAVYQAKHAYIGDMSANGRSANALGMGNVLGSFKNELQTTEEPYGWKIILEEEIQSADQSAMEQQMKAYTCVLLATIDNLGYMTYEYTTEDGAASLTMTAEEASAFVGQDIKTCAATVAELQALMQQIGLNEYGIPSTKTMEESVRLDIVHSADAEIAAIDIAYYLDEKLCGSQGVIHADGSLLRRNEKLSFEFTSEEFGQDLQEVSELRFELEVTDEAGNVYEVSSPVQVIADTGYSYVYILSGNAVDGFVLEQ